MNPFSGKLVESFLFLLPGNPTVTCPAFHSGSGLELTCGTSTSSTGSLTHCSPGRYCFLKCQGYSTLPQWDRHIINDIETQLTVTSWKTSSRSNVMCVPSNKEAKELTADYFSWKVMCWHRCCCPQEMPSPCWTDAEKSRALERGGRAWRESGHCLLEPDSHLCLRKLSDPSEFRMFPDGW